MTTTPATARHSVDSMIAALGHSIARLAIHNHAIAESGLSGSHHLSSKSGRGTSDVPAPCREEAVMEAGHVDVELEQGGGG